MAVARNLFVRVGADLSGFGKGMRKAQKQLAGFQLGISRAASGIATALAGIGATIGAGFLAAPAVSDAMKFEALMLTIKESLGESSKDFEKWQASSGRALGFSKLQSAELANVLSLNFKKFATDQQDLLGKTTKMMETAALIANKRGMSMEEVSDRIRSAMNQEADGADELGVNVREASIIQSKAYKEMADGKPWQQLNENMRKSILYHHILESVATNLGTTIQDTTSMRMNVFVATLKDLRLAIGQAFLPMLNVALPILTQFVDKLTKAASKVTEIMKGIFGLQGKDISSTSQVVDQTTSSVDDMTESLKEAKKAQQSLLAGFDQLNILQSPSSPSSASSGSAGGSSESNKSNAGASSIVKAPDPTAFEKAGARIRAALANIFNNPTFQKYSTMFKNAFSEIGKVITGFFGSMAAYFKSGDGKMFFEGIANLFKWLYPIIKFVVDIIVTDIKTLFSGIKNILQGAMTFFGALLTGNWGKMWDGFLQVLKGALKVAWVVIQYFFGGKIFGVIGKFMSKFGGKILKFFKDIPSNIINFFSGGNAKLGSVLKKWIDNAWSATKNAFKNLGGNAWDAIKSAFKTIGSVLFGDLSIGEGALNSLKKLGSGIWDAIKSKFGSIVAVITMGLKLAGVALENLKNLGKNIWTNIKNNFGTIVSVIAFGIKLAGAALENLKNLGKNIWANIKNNFGTIVSVIAFGIKLAGAALQNLKTLGSNIWKNIKNNFGSIVDVVTSGLSIGADVAKKLAKLGSDIWESIKKGFGNIGEFFGDLFGGDDKKGKTSKTGNRTKSINTSGLKLATGGITTGATMAMIGEAGKEAVLPLENNTGWMDTLASKIGGMGEVVINVGGAEIGRVTQKQLNQMARMSGRAVINV